MDEAFAVATLSLAMPAAKQLAQHGGFVVFLSSDQRTDGGNERAHKAEHWPFDG